MHRELVERRRWVADGTFLHALNFCMLLPGPEAQQLATYLGWRLHGIRGGVAAGVLFVIPSILILYALSWLYMAGGDAPWIRGLFHGLMPAVIAIVVAAVFRIGKKSLRSRTLVAIALLAFLAVAWMKLSFVWVVLAAAIAGWVGGRWLPRQFPAGKGHGVAEAGHTTVAGGWGRALRIGGCCLALWWLPVAACGWWSGWEGLHFQQGLFFSKAALVTFGGAYAVLPYVSQMAVGHYGWLDHGQMMAGLALAETTPGPLIMVLQFVGFVAGWQHPGSMSPLLSATLGAGITTWVTFLPCFLFVLLGAPHVEGLRGKPALSGALAAITAAVVGVMLNLAIWFAGHALFPASGGVDWFVACAAPLAWIAMERFRIGALPVLAACAAAGMVMALTGVG
jgi:chromate transporter